MMTTITTPRLDVLLYAHDGRGLGHASRTAAVGMALRRCYPGLRVLFVSGCRMSRELIGDVPLDWLKLPSYETEVKEGKSRGIDGHSGFSDTGLGELRARQLADIVRLYRPRVVLCDHAPQGKHRELLPALKATEGEDTRWLLGVRGIVGQVQQVKSELARAVFQDHYHGLFWFGDSRVLGTEGMKKLEELYGAAPLECGYVSRLAEIISGRPGQAVGGGSYCGTLSIPWLGQGTMAFLKILAGALATLAPEYGKWRLFVNHGETPAARAAVTGLFQGLSHCELEQPSGQRYVDALLQSRSALIFGGYNSVMDVLSMGLPATVVLRQMDDGEQQDHLAKLSRFSGTALRVVSETGVDKETLAGCLLDNLRHSEKTSHRINLQGAENAAMRISQMLK